MVTSPCGEPSRELERRAGDQHPLVRRHARQDLAGRNAHAEDAAVAHVDRTLLCGQLRRGPDGPQGVVLASDGQAEHGRHADLIGTLDDAAVALDRSPDDLLRPSFVRLEDLGVEVAVDAST